ncbi:MAG: hypothetical protein G01um10148_727 [Parcubacteria group bacterium Gr01-1014_8]|nr:MAG: hypothetical protein G01um10148_727 [Parcubacteria group bacterium Gr01-1014_8]
MYPQKDIRYPVRDRSSLFEYHFSMTRGLILASSAAFIVLLGLGSVFIAQTYETPSDPNIAVTVLKTCAEHRLVACARPEIRRLLTNMSGAEILDLFSEKFSTVKCHTLGHIVGQELYLAKKNVEHALAVCNNACASSCVHGVIGEAFLQEAGITEKEGLDTLHMSPEDIRALGIRLCASVSTCHGVGHALFMAYGEFPPALAACSEIASGARRTFCYRGVFMQYADMVSENSVRDAEYISLPARGSLQSLCAQTSSDELRACMRYLPRIYAELTDRSQAGLEKFCESYSDAERRIGCFLGIGVARADMVFKDPAATHHVCEDLEMTGDRASCTLGMISSAAEYKRIPELLSYCQAVGELFVRHICYHGVFQSLSFMMAERAETEVMSEHKKLCEGHGSECLNGLYLHNADPWETIVGTSKK